MNEVNRLIEISEFLKVISTKITSPSHLPTEIAVPKKFSFKVFIITIDATDDINHWFFKTIKIIIKQECTH